MVKLKKPGRVTRRISVTLYAGGPTNEGCNCCSW